MAQFVFKESQRFTQLWIWTILLIVTGITVYGITSKPFEGWDAILPLVIIGLVITLFINMKLETRIDEHSLTFSFFPFIGKRKYTFDQIVSLELIEYNSLLKFGGWGIRYNLDMWGYNVGGKHGLIVTLKNKKFLLGTQRPAEMQKAIDQFMNIKQGNHGG